MKDVITLYNKKRSLFSNISSQKDSSACLDNPARVPDFPLTAVSPIAIVIPACDEFPGILDTLESIQFSINNVINLDKSEYFDKFEYMNKSAYKNNSIKVVISIIIVVNNRSSASQSIKQNNQQLLQYFKNHADPLHPCVRSPSVVTTKIVCCENDFPASATKCKVLALDCASEGCEIPEGQGVGWARKYGMDYALLCGTQVLACMDADTLVSENYASELLRFFGNCRYALAQKKPVPSGAVLHFTHQTITDAKTQQAIARYEFFIKDHSQRLKKTGAPYYPWALGPSIVCSAHGYAASGGMNKRLAGEDFYFLQSLVKLHLQQMPHNSHSVKDWSVQREDFPLLDSTVYPQARFSDRVLFGTGKKLQALVEGAETISLYPDIVYKKIACLLDIFLQTQGNPIDFSQTVKMGLSDVWVFLEKENFFVVWEKLYRQNNSSTTRLYTSFHSWFDGLKILRLIHFLTQ